jgi:hypothetical protein
MRSIDHLEPDVLLAPGSEEIEREVNVPAYYIGSDEYRESLRRQVRNRRTLWEKLVDGFRRAWDGPDPGPLTDEEMRLIMRRAEEEFESLPERVPPDDPDRLAWEAELRAIGVRPAKKWSSPNREPRRRPGLWQRIRYRISLGW